MTQKYNVLIVDDHPLIIEAYKNALLLISANYSPAITFKIDTANNCDTAFDKIKEAKKDQLIDLIFLDIKLPPSKNKKILSGEDLGIKVRDLIPKTKIIISTTFNDNYRIHSIIKSINPDGFLIKNDITKETLIEGISTIIKDPPYYSQTVIKLMRKEMSNNFTLDNIDRQLLYELSIGTKMKDLPNILPLSIAGIEKRKRHIKEAFDLDEQNDKTLIQIAKEKGFI